MLITSKTNEKVKFVKSLNDKKFRQKNNAYYLEGLKVTYEILKSEEAVNIMFIAYSSEILETINQSNINLKEIIDICNKKNIILIDIEKNIFDKMCETMTPQGILCVLKKNNKILKEEIAKNKDKNIFILDGVSDLGNIGTIVRNSVAFDIKNIIALSNTADVYSPKALRSTMGTILKVNMFYENDNESLIKILKENGYEIVGTSLEDSEKITSLDFSKKYAFVLGNEANGVSKEILKKCDKKIKIEMSNEIESLNVAIASGIIGYVQYVNKK